MLQISKSKDEIVIRELPVAQWFNSVIVGAVILLLFFTALSSVPDLTGLAWSLGIIVPVVGVLFYLLSNPSITIKINKPGKTVSVRKQSLLGYKFDVYSFNEIADLIYVDEFGALPKTYQIILPLKKAQKIELSAQIEMNKTEYFEAADLMNQYIFNTPKQLSAKAMAWKLKKTDL